MDLKVFRSTWGLSGLLTTELERVAAADFDGVEVLVPPFPPVNAAEQRRTVLASGLEAIPLILSWDGNRDAYRRTIDAALEYNPHQVTSHTASDVMSDAEALDFLEFTLDLEREIGVPINHETHRGHIFHTSWQTARLLRVLPDLHLVADYSHWVVVAERFLGDRAEDLALANGHVAHIHARVGQPQGPQVNDPRSPTNADAVAVFEGWWKDIFRRRAASGAERITVTPEYGPPPYLPVLPFTDEPVADLWEVCLWGAAQVRRLFAEAMADG